jgi:hypothetical protein
MPAEGDVKEGSMGPSVANGGAIGFRAGRSAEICSQYDILEVSAVQGKRLDPPLPTKHPRNPTIKLNAHKSSRLFCLRYGSAKGLKNIHLDHEGYPQDNWTL